MANENLRNGRHSKRGNRKRKLAGIRVENISKGGKAAALALHKTGRGTVIMPFPAYFLYLKD
jgi:hypothetical protein